MATDPRSTFRASMKLIGTLIKMALVQTLSLTVTVEAFVILSSGVIAKTRLDPLIAPGAISSHVHNVVGGNAFSSMVITHPIYLRCSLNLKSLCSMTQTLQSATRLAQVRLSPLIRATTGPLLCTGWIIAPALLPRSFTSRVVSIFITSVSERPHDIRLIPLCD
jgi:hypothetical protein